MDEKLFDLGGEELIRLNEQAKLEGLKAALEDCETDKEFHILMNEELEKKVKELETENRYLKMKLKKIKEITDGQI